MNRLGTAFIVVVLSCAASAYGQTMFTATLTGDQEVPNPVATNASGTAELVLNAAQDQLSITINIDGLDLDGNQTPDNGDDDVVGLHIHAAPAGSNGGVVFGFISPNNDTNGDLVIDPVLGEVFSVWDLNEGNNTTLGDQLDELFSEGLYINAHTPANPGGEIRGQIVPEPASVAMMLGVAGLVGFRRRYARA
jgi:hypothetical protein